MSNPPNLIRPSAALPSPPLWKVYAAKAGVSFNETVLYDLYYARNMTPFMDAYIVIMTVWVILTGRADG